MSTKIEMRPEVAENEVAAVRLALLLEEAQEICLLNGLPHVLLAVAMSSNGRYRAAAHIGMDAKTCQSRLDLLMSSKAIGAATFLAAKGADEAFQRFQLMDALEVAGGTN